MLTSIEPITKEWYDYLKKDRLMGLKCRKCGRIMFPPVPVCASCYSTDMEWAEIDPEGELCSFNMNSTGIFPYTDAVTLSGYLRMKDGTIFVSQIIGYGPDDQKKLFDMLKAGTVRARLVPAKLNDDFKYPFIEILD